MKRDCLDCGVLTTETRCPPCQRQHRKGSTRQWRKLRLYVLNRDSYRCRYCGQRADTVDHVKPLAYGGSDDPRNLVAACGPCNYSKQASIARLRQR